MLEEFSQVMTSQAAGIVIHVSTQSLQDRLQASRLGILKTPHLGMAQKFKTWDRRSFSLVLVASDSWVPYFDP